MNLTTAILKVNNQKYSILGFSHTKVSRILSNQYIFDKT